MKFVLAALSAASVLAVSTSADAVPRPCPVGSVWDGTDDACRKVRKVRRQSPEKQFQSALKLLDEKADGFNAQRGLKLLEKACDRKLGKACFSLGWHYRHGRHIEASVDKSLELFEKACELDSSQGCVGAAELHSQGLVGRRPDHEKAIPFLTKACNLGSGTACADLGEKYAKALGTKRSDRDAKKYRAKALVLLEGACPERPKACMYLGTAYLQGLGTKANNSKAVAAWRQGCTAGGGDACRALGDVYKRGQGVPVDVVESVRFYKRACNDFDNAEACFSAGFMMANWAAANRDERAIRGFAERACLIDKRFCILRGYLYTIGVAYKVNARLATKDFIESCTSGSKEACKFAGDNAATGRGTPKSDTRAVEYWRRACRMGEATACRSLGESYENGRGVAKNIVSAKVNYGFACLRDDGAGCVARGDLAAKDKNAKPNAGEFYFKKACRLSAGVGCARMASRAKDEAKKSEWLSKACSADHVESCHTAGTRLYFGNGGVTDKAEAGVFFARACELGDEQRCFWIEEALASSPNPKKGAGRALAAVTRGCEVKNVPGACRILAFTWVHGGKLGNKQTDRGVKLYRSRCKAGDRESCLEVGRLYSMGAGVPADAEKAESIYREECERNTPNACWMLGFEQWKRGDHEAAAPLFKRACDENSAAACNMAAFVHYTGQGQTWDTTRGAELYQKSCELGFPLACANVGELYRLGVVVEKDDKKSFEFNSKGCTPIESSGCTWVGRAYHLGSVVDVDLERAEREYLRTCVDEEWASAESCLFLAELYEKTGKQSKSRVASLRQQAFQIAEKNIKSSGYYHHLVGTFHMNGIATMQDAAKAADHFKKGCEGFDPQSCIAGAKLFLAGADGVEADRKQAAFMAERACAAAIAGGCELAEEARKPAVKTPTGPTPAVVDGKKGCAGCGSQPSGGGALLVLLLVVLARRQLLAH